MGTGRPRGAGSASRRVRGAGRGRLRAAALSLLLGLPAACSGAVATGEANAGLELSTAPGGRPAAVLVAPRGPGAHSAASPGPAWVLTVEPEHLVPGTPLRVTIAVPPTAEVGGSFLGRDLVFLPRPGGDGRIAFAGVDLDRSPGAYVLSVEVVEADGSSTAHAIDLTVESKEYPTERLTVEPQYVEPPLPVQERITREAGLLKSIWARASNERLFDGRVFRPLGGVEGRNFGRRRLFNSQPRSPHSGTDLSAPAGTPVAAAATGIVVLSKNLYFSGNLVVLDHGGDVYTLYAHLSEIDVAEGERVRAGQIVGKVGATGRVTGPHLHWGARIGEARVEPRVLLELLTFP